MSTLATFQPDVRDSLACSWAVTAPWWVITRYRAPFSSRKLSSLWYTSHLPVSREGASRVPTGEARHIDQLGERPARGVRDGPPHLGHACPAARRTGGRNFAVSWLCEITGP